MQIGRHRWLQPRSGPAASESGRRGSVGLPGCIEQATGPALAAPDLLGDLPRLHPLTLPNMPPRSNSASPRLMSAGPNSQWTTPSERTPLNPGSWFFGDGIWVPGAGNPGSLTCVSLVFSLSDMRRSPTTALRSAFDVEPLPLTAFLTHACRRATALASVLPWVPAPSSVASPTMMLSWGEGGWR